MNVTTRTLCCLAALLFCVKTPAPAAGPFVNGKFQGRIAYSADGNHNDPDDWIASPMALAILAESGLKDRLVHFDYNSILPQTTPEWEKHHADGVLGAVERYHYDKSLFIDCRRELDRALNGIAQAINASSANDPLYFVIAGPMEVPVRGIEKADPAKLRHVYAISHSRWNDGFSPGYKFTHSKRSVIERGVHWVQIPDQNRLLSFGRYGRPSPPEEFQPYFWLRDSPDPRLQFLWERMLLSTRPDPSDAGMMYFLASGDSACDPAKLERLLAGHHAALPISERKRIRLEAENFRALEEFTVEDRNDKSASHRLNVLRTGSGPGRIRTTFDEPFSAGAGKYQVTVRHSGDTGAPTRVSLAVNGQPLGEAVRPKPTGQWSDATFFGVGMGIGATLTIETEGSNCRLDFVELEIIDGK